jgi:hypothetical protein
MEFFIGRYKKSVKNYKKSVKIQKKPGN